MRTKAETIASVAADAGVTKADAERVLDAFFGMVKTEVKKGEKVAWSGFGTFSMSERAPRMGRNPRTGEQMQFAKSRSLKLSTAAGAKKELLA